MVGSGCHVRVDETCARPVAEGELRGTEPGAHRVERRDGCGKHHGVRNERRKALDDLGEREIPVAVVRDQVNEHAPSFA